MNCIVAVVEDFLVEGEVGGLDWRVDWMEDGEEIACS